jgi:hypothetical protein
MRNYCGTNRPIGDTGVTNSRCATISEKKKYNRHK